MAEIIFSSIQGSHETKSDQGHKINYDVTILYDREEPAYTIQYETKDRMVPQADTIKFENGSTVIEDGQNVFRLDKEEEQEEE
ncbi:hypothetical protein ATL39_2585 [Sinobaca qinghaiensis]|uniref:Uncharacterized protein n=1 Tax=Sinobaca qinghaiensis TaxID=342944 RepID=A0A419UZZ3_9BACL|nr:hypothetical protein [Sinobaca qinghaiensis]RKD71190.1 hypothetical protein ATL39_2585 [Sinobaca qinghaiensis]